LVVGKLTDQQKVNLKQFLFSILEDRFPEYYLEVLTKTLPVSILKDLIYFEELLCFENNLSLMLIKILKYKIFTPEEILKEVSRIEDTLNTIDLETDENGNEKVSIPLYESILSAEFRKIMPDVHTIYDLQDLNENNKEAINEWNEKSTLLEKQLGKGSKPYLWSYIRNKKEILEKCSTIKKLLKEGVDKLLDSQKRIIEEELQKKLVELEDAKKNPFIKIDPSINKECIIS